MGRTQSIELQSASEVVVEELRVDHPFWMQSINDDDLAHEGSEGLVEPQAVL